MNSNFCTLKGEIKYIFKTHEDHILVRIHTGRSNVPEVLITNPTLKENFNFKVGDKIIVFANIQSSIYKNRRSTTLLAFSIRELVYGNHEEFNSFELSGEVVKIVSTQEYLTLVIRTNQNNHESFVPTVFYHRDRYLDTIEVGDEISVSGIIQTSKKEINNEIRHYQNYVGSTKSLLRVS